MINFSHMFIFYLILLIYKKQKFFLLTCQPFLFNNCVLTQPGNQCKVLSCTFYLLIKGGLVPLPFKELLFPATLTLTSQSQRRRSRHVSLLWLVVSLPFCPEQHIKLTKLKSNFKSRQCWSDMNPDITPLSVSASEHISVNTSAVNWDCLWPGSHVCPHS